MENNKQLFLRITGLLGAISSLSAAASDIALSHAPISPLKLNLYLFLQAKPQSRLLIGHYLGILSFPLAVLALWHIYQAIKPAGRWLSLPPLLLTGYGYICAAVWHGAFAYFNSGLQARDAVLGEALVPLNGMIDKFKDYFIPLFWIISAIFLVAFLWFFMLIVLRRTLYPRWLALLSPAPIVIYFWLVSLLLPPAISGALWSAGLNIAGIILFGASTLLLWNVNKNQ